MNAIPWRPLRWEDKKKDQEDHERETAEEIAEETMTSDVTHVFPVLSDGSYSQRSGLGCLSPIGCKEWGTTWSKNSAVKKTFNCA